MAHCTFCHHDNPQGVLNCQACGANLVEPDRPPAELVPEILALLADQGKIVAIKRYREATGAGLKEAKDAVQAIERGETAPSTSAWNASAEQELIDLLREGRKIEAIRLYRSRTGADLLAAKNAVEKVAQDHAIAVSQRSGCLGTIVILLLVLASVMSLRS